MSSDVLPMISKRTTTHEGEVRELEELEASIEGLCNCCKRGDQMQVAPILIHRDCRASEHDHEVNGMT